MALPVAQVRALHQPWCFPHPQGSCVQVFKLGTVPHLKGCHSHWGLSYTRTSRGALRRRGTSEDSPLLGGRTPAHTKGHMYAHTLSGLLSALLHSAPHALPWLEPDLASSWGARGDGGMRGRRRENTVPVSSDPLRPHPAQPLPTSGHPASTPSPEHASSCWQGAKAALSFRPQGRWPLLRDPGRSVSGSIHVALRPLLPSHDLSVSRSMKCLLVLKLSLLREGKLCKVRCHFVFCSTI